MIPLAPRVDPVRLRLIVITNSGLAGPGRLLEVVEAALEAGAPAIQFRDKHGSASEQLPVARKLRELTVRHGALLFVNDRVDVALLAEADGAHLGPTDLPVSAARAIVPDHFILGYSADDPDIARGAVVDGADYIGCGTVWRTTSKEDAGEVIGLDGLTKVVEAVPVPVVAIGGVTEERAPLVRRTGAAGVAVVGAVMGAPEPASVVDGLLSVWPKPENR